MPTVKPGLQRIVIHNFQIIKDLTIDLNGESMIVLGESGIGKSTLSKMILAHMDQIKYPTNPLSDGQDEGFTHSEHIGHDGKLYTVVRKFKRDKNGVVDSGRFDVRAPDGVKRSLEYIMAKVFNGVFTNAKFDYNTYFNKKASDVSRYQYMRDAIGGSQIDENKNQIDKWEKERGPIGTQRDAKKLLWANINTDTIVEDTEKFMQAKTADSANQVKIEYLKQVQDVSVHDKKLEVSRLATNEIYNIDTKVDSVNSEKNDILEEINRLQDLLLVKDEEIAALVVKRGIESKKVLSTKAFTDLQKKVQTITAKNDKIIKDADVVYQKALDEVVQFGIDKAAFMNGINALDEWEVLDAKWNELDTNISDKRKENHELFTSLLPLPELSIGTNNKGDYIVLYNGREFSSDNLSTGEQIEITARIQLSLNPSGGNFIVIPNANSLGSKLKEIKASCEKFKVQYLVEMTVPEAEFTVEVIEAGKE